MSRNLVELRRKRHGEDVHSTLLSKLRGAKLRGDPLDADGLRTIARACRQPEASAFGVLSYYDDLAQPSRPGSPRLCVGSACHGADPTRAKSHDGTVQCLGLCHIGDAAMVDGRAVAPWKGGANPGAEPYPPFRFAPPDSAIVLERLGTGRRADSLRDARDGNVLDGIVRALDELTPEQLLHEVRVSGLRGRGGAGFPTATKWALCRQHAVSAGTGYVVANADEGDPGSYIDRVLLEEDPYNILEGMLLTGYAVGCTRGVIYVRSEYPRAYDVVAAAVEGLREAGFLGARIRGSAFSFEIDVVSGAGSYVCGEETALLRSLEGQRGMVTARPPFPAERGLFGKPTVVSNVETLASLGFIARRGGAHYATFGTERSRGTKVLCTNSLFVRPGLYELPMGSRLDHLLFDLSLGLRDGRHIKLLQIGGPLGGILTPRDFDTKLTFEDLEAKGALLGHGGIVAWDQNVDARDILLRLFSFAEEESCGKCFPCRIGTVRGREIAERLYEPRGAQEIDEDLALLDELCDILKGGSLCAHGGGLPLPVRALVREFSNELRAGAQ